MKAHGRTKHLIKLTISILIVLFVVPNFIIVQRLPIHPIADHPRPAGQEQDNKPTLIVLGAGVRRRELSGMLRCRMLKALELYNNQTSARVLLSGDGTEPNYNETIAMRKFAIQNGINPSALLMDPLGFSTYDSLRRAVEVFGIRSALVVTQEFHIDRAVWLARSFGMSADGESCDNGASSMFYNVREFAARSKDVLLRWFDFAPRSTRDELF